MGGFQAFNHEVRHAPVCLVEHLVQGAAGSIVGCPWAAAKRSPAIAHVMDVMWADHRFAKIARAVDWGRPMSLTCIVVRPTMPAVGRCRVSWLHRWLYNHGRSRPTWFLGTSHLPIAVCCVASMATLVAVNVVGDSDAGKTPTESAAWVIGALDGADEPEHSSVIKYLDDDRRRSCWTSSTGSGRSCRRRAGTTRSTARTGPRRRPATVSR
jgi:hypothetical protein